MRRRRRDPLGIASAPAVLAPLVVLLWLAPPSLAQTPMPPAPASGLTWTDVPNDAGRAVSLSWRGSPDESTATAAVAVDSTGRGVTTRDDQSLRRDTVYFYRITTFGPGGRTPALSVTGPVRATSQWINQTRWSVLVFLVAFFGFVLFYMASAQSGNKPFVRRIPGIDAIEEAIGRATEMGRPVLYVPGIQDIDQMETVAGLVILENVAKITARYETPIKVPVSYPIPFTIAEEMVKSGYLHAGK